jgi:subfamily B ATP-binding cassette protein MsbA
MREPTKALPLIKRLWRESVRHHTSELFALVPALIAVALIGVGYGLIMKQVGDLLQARDLSVTTFAPFLLVAATVARAGAIWLQAVASQGLGQKVLRDLQNAMFAKLTHADYARLTGEPTGQMVSRFTSDINVIAESLIRGAQAVMRDAVSVIGALAAMFFYDWPLALLVIGLFVMAGPPLSGIAHRARRQTIAAQELMGRLTHFLTQSFSSARLVKTYALETREQARADATFEDRRKLSMKLVHNRARVDPLMEIIGGLALASVLYLAGARIISGAMSFGDLLGMITAVAAAAPAARSLGTFNTVMNEGVAALSRVYGLLDERESVIDKPGAQPLVVNKGALEFENVSFAYGHAPALKQVSFTVAAGDTIAFVGGSGAGKTTIFNLIPRLYDPSQGRILIDGQDIAGVTLTSLRQSIALVAQDALLFDDSVRANIAYGRPAPASDDEIEAAARAAAAHDFIMALPQGYATPVGERGASLSGGERQRIALARAFLRNAPILLLDEATSALDAANEALVQTALEQVSRGRTTLIIAHRLSTIRHATRIFVMEKGAIVETGDHASLMALNGHYARLAALQENA